MSTKFRSTLRKSLVTSGRKTKQLDNHMKSSGITPPSYRGPELFDRERNIREPIKSTDIWALGATLYELATAELPYGEFGGLIQLQNAPPPVLPNQFSKELTIVLQHCMAKETWDRPIAKDLINYAKTYLRSGKWPKLEAPAIPSSPTTSPTVPQGIATIRDGQNDFGRKYGKQSQGNRKNWWWIAALILLLLGGTGGWFFYQQDVSKRADAAYASAEQYFEAKDFFNAKEKYRESRRLKDGVYPDIAEKIKMASDSMLIGEQTNIIKGERLLEDNDLQGAGVAFQRALRFNPESQPAQEKISAIQGQLDSIFQVEVEVAREARQAGEYEKASQAIKKAQELKPEDKEIIQLAEEIQREADEAKYNQLISGAKTDLTNGKYRNAEKKAEEAQNDCRGCAGAFD
ncbi:MAG: protein kinase [Bacteroidota bacterium]